MMKLDTNTLIRDYANEYSRSALEQIASTAEAQAHALQNVCGGNETVSRAFTRLATACRYMVHLQAGDQQSTVRTHIPAKQIRRSTPAELEADRMADRHEPAMSPQEIDDCMDAIAAELDTMAMQHEADRMQVDREP